MATIAPGFANDVRGEAARLIAEVAPGDLNKVFFTNGGAEANENAVRMARLHTGRHKVLAAYRSYHGATAGAITLTGDPRRWPSEPGIAGRRALLGPLPVPLGLPRHRPRPRSASAPWRTCATCSMVEGPGTVAAIVLETVVGTNGILVPPAGYLAGVRELCDEHGIVLIADEVMAGFGRCGEWFAVDHWGVTPDLITFAKGVNSGYVPLGGVIISDAIAATFDQRPFPGGLTYSGHPLACASAVASINAMRAEGIIEHAAQLGERRDRPRLCGTSPSGTRRSARSAAWASSGPSSWSATARPASRWCRSTPPAPRPRRWPSSRPPARRAACGRSRTSTAPTSCRRVRRPRRRSSEGIAILDEALTVADRYYTGTR